MSDPTDVLGRPSFGANRPTVLFLVWLFVGLSMTGIGMIDLVNRSFGDAWLLLFGGGFLLAYIVRDWRFRRGGDFVTRADSRAFLLLTTFVFLLTVWILLEGFVL